MPNHVASRYGLPLAATALAAIVPCLAGQLLSARIASLGITLPYFSEVAFHLAQLTGCAVVGFIGIAVVAAINRRYTNGVGLPHLAYVSFVALYLSLVLLGLIIPLRVGV